MGAAELQATEFVEANGTRLACSVQGTGPVVLYAHGLFCSRAVDSQRGLVDFSPVAEAGCRLVAYDARGHGDSRGGERAEAFRWSSLADDLLALADHFSAGAPVSVIGLSMGTGTALHAALKRPARFRKLVLTAPPTAWHTRAAQVQVYRKLAAVAASGKVALLEKAVAMAPVAPIFANSPRSSPLEAVALPTLPLVLAGASASDLPSEAVLQTLHTPTLILGWATDPAHPVSTAETLAALLPNAQLHVAQHIAEIATWGDQAARFLQG
ncbi:alpha/beta hydrolase [Ideonella azotifigens]|uniref:Alpha/beta hydrolase n=1 Tax=Ideonella azotifigens TaxID=513160 RepID=A0ABN1KGE6_9BURK|nr:alpha/beta fold hydrolase [Ideonella azotifigens]MCD2340387.1 alpha/beta hydrolase [Ideonella azotifigens]